MGNAAARTCRRRFRFRGAEPLTGRNRGAQFRALIRRAVMRRTRLVICEVCGSGKPSGASDFLVFHCLTFCSPDCLGDYRTADEQRRIRKEPALSRPQSTSRRSRAA
jgi:hypothetical protein